MWQALRWALISLLALKLSGATETCYEKCFRVFGQENYAYRDVLEDIFELGSEINRVRNLYKIARIGFLVDSTLAPSYNVSDDPFDDRLKNGIEIFQFQSMLRKLLVFMTGTNKNYIVQFNEKNAWTCFEQACYPQCNTPHLSSLVMNTTTSQCPGNIEAACRLLSYQTTNVYCAQTSTNMPTLVVALVNSDFFMNDPERRRNSLHNVKHSCKYLYKDSLSNFTSSSSSSEEENFYSPCRALFQHRFIIATSTVNDDVLKQFPSRTGNFKYLRANRFSFDALKVVTDCLSTAPGCCPTLSNITETKCSITSGVLGESIVSYPTHPALL